MSASATSSSFVQYERNKFPSYLNDLVKFYNEMKRSNEFINIEELLILDIAEYSVIQKYREGLQKHIDKYTKNVMKKKL